MSLFGKLLARLFSMLFGVFGKFLAVDRALHVAGVVSCLVVLTALYAAVYTCVEGPCASAVSNLGAVAPNVGVGFGIAWNPVTLTAASCYMSVWILCNVYIIRKRMMNMFLGK